MRKRSHRIKFQLNEKEVNQLNRDVKKAGFPVKAICGSS